MLGKHTVHVKLRSIRGNLYKNYFHEEHGAILLVVRLDRPAIRSFGHGLGEECLGFLRE